MPGKIILQNFVPATPSGAAPLPAFFVRAAVVFEDELVGHAVHESDQMQWHFAFEVEVSKTRVFKTLSNPDFCLPELSSPLFVEKPYPACNQPCYLRSFAGRLFTIISK